MQHVLESVAAVNELSFVIQNFQTLHGGHI